MTWLHVVLVLAFGLILSLFATYVVSVLAMDDEELGRIIEGWRKK